MPQRNTVEIVIKGEDQTSSLDSINSKLDNLNKIVSFEAIINGVKAIGNAIIDLGQSGASLEGIQKAFDGIAESTGKSATEVLDNLRASSAGMITNRDLMKSYNTAAQLVSKTFANQLPDAMQYLTKISAATGQDVGFMLDSLVKGVGRVSPMILDNLGVQVNLTEATTAYAAEIGKSVDQLTKQEQQTAIMNATLAKLKENTASMPDVVGTAGAGFAAFEARISNLRDNIGLKLLPAFEAIVNFGSLLIDALAPVITQFLEPVVTFIQGIFNGVMMLITGDFTGGFFGLDEDHPAVVAILAIRDAIEAIGAGVNPFDAIATGILDVAQAAENYGFTGLADVLRGIAIAVAGIPELFERVKETARQLVTIGLLVLSQAFTDAGLAAQQVVNILAIGFNLAVVAAQMIVTLFIATVIRIKDEIVRWLDENQRLVDVIIALIEAVALVKLGLIAYNVIVGIATAVSGGLAAGAGLAATAVGAVTAAVGLLLSPVVTVTAAIWALIAAYKELQRFQQTVDTAQAAATTQLAPGLKRTPLTLQQFKDRAFASSVAELGDLGARLLWGSSTANMEGRVTQMYNDAMKAGGAYAAGTRKIFREDLYRLHPGEQVLRPDQQSEGARTINVNFNGTGGPVTEQEANESGYMIAGALQARGY